MCRRRNPAYSRRQDEMKDDKEMKKARESKRKYNNAGLLSHHSSKKQ